MQAREEQLKREIRWSLMAAFVVLVFLLFYVAFAFAGPPLGVAPTALSQAQTLQAVIDQGGPLVFVPKGTYEVAAPIRLRSNLILQFESGTALVAAEGAFKGINDSLVVMEDLDHVAIQAEGAIFRMQKALYRKPDLYVDSEFRHVFDVRGCRDVSLYGGTFADSGGDGIYLGPFVKPDKSRVENERINIRRVTCDNNLRQGISIVSCVDCLIEDSVLKNTNGKSPQAGCDVEPQWGDLIDVTIRRCHADGSRGPGWMWSLQHLVATDPPARIVMLDCTYANVPIDQPALRMTGIYNDETKPTGYLKSNLPPGTELRWDSLILRK